MKVIKHGQVLRFTCTACGAEYVAGVHEARDCGFYIDAECPDCGTVNKAKETAEESDK